MFEKLFDFFRKLKEEEEEWITRGHIEVEPRPDDFVLGGENEAIKNVMQSDRDWSPYLPIKELQNRGFETWACVSFARNNCLEILHKKMYGIEPNYSDRFMAKVSNTVVGRGNNFANVAQSGRKFGSVAESVYPWGGHDVSQYYQKIPDDVLKLGKDLLLDYEFQYEWVDWGGCNPEKLWEALQYSPLEVSVYAWGKRSGSVYLRTLNNVNHGTTLFKGEYKKFWYVYDSYDETIKKLAWNFNFGSAMRHALKKKRMLELISSNDDPRIFAVDAKQIKRHILNEAQFKIGHEAGLWGDWESVRVIHKTRLEGYGTGEPIVFASL